MSQVYDDQAVEVLLCQHAKLQQDFDSLAQVVQELKEVHAETVKSRDEATIKWGETLKLEIQGEARIRELEAEIRKLHGWRVEDSERIRQLQEVRKIHESCIQKAREILGAHPKSGINSKIQQAINALEGK